jgi:hypothetical protein
MCEHKISRRTPDIFSEFFNILKYDFLCKGAFAPMSQSEYPDVS